MQRIFTDFAHKTAVYAAMLERIECGPFDGGCLVFAQALQRVLGGELYVIEGTNRFDSRPAAQHALLKLADGRFADGSGIGTQRGIVRRLVDGERFFQLVVTQVRPLRDSDLECAARDELLVQELAQLLEPARTALKAAVSSASRRRAARRPTGHGAGPAHRPSS